MATKVLITRPFPSPIDAPHGYDWFSKVEIPKEGAVVVDGYRLNTEGSPIGTRLRYAQPGRLVYIVRLSVDSWEVGVQGFTEETQSVTTPPDDLEHTYSSFPQYPIWPTGQAQHPQTVDKGEGRDLSVATLKYAVRYLYDQLNGWYDQVIQLGRYHSAKQRDIAHDFLFEARRFIYVVATKHAPFRNLTLKQRIDCCYQMALGAADITSPETFYKSDITTAPDFPVGWVKPTTSERINLDTAIDEFSSGARSGDLHGMSTLDKDWENADWLSEIRD